MKKLTLSTYKKLFVMCTLLLITAIPYAEKNTPSIKVGEPLPYTEYSGRKNGLLMINNKKNIDFIPWDTKNLIGKPHVIYHLAARDGAQYINAATVDVIDSLHIPEKKLSFLTLLNGDDVPFGLTSIARGQFIKNKKAYPSSIFVFDDKSKAQKAWHLKRKSSALMLLDATGHVLFYKEGRLSKQESSSLINLIKELVK